MRFTAIGWIVRPRLIVEAPWRTVEYTQAREGVAHRELSRRVRQLTRRASSEHGPAPAVMLQSECVCRELNFRKRRQVKIGYDRIRRSSADRATAIAGICPSIPVFYASTGCRARIARRNGITRAGSIEVWKRLPPRCRGKCDEQEPGRH